MKDLPTLGAPGRNWVLETLRDGLSLGRAVAAILSHDEVSVHAVVGGEVSTERLEQDFTEGLLIGPVAGKATRRLADALNANFAGTHLVLELPEDRPSDRWYLYPEGGTPSRMTCGEELYASCAIGDGGTIIQHTLHYRDSVWGYNAFIVAGLPADQISGCPTTLLQEGVVAIMAIIVGAYDGEGYLLAVPSVPLAVPNE